MLRRVTLFALGIVTLAQAGWVSLGSGSATGSRTPRGMGRLSSGRGSTNGCMTIRRSGSAGTRGRSAAIRIRARAVSSALRIAMRSWGATSPATGASAPAGSRGRCAVMGRTPSRDREARSGWTRRATSSGGSPCARARRAIWRRGGASPTADGPPGRPAAGRSPRSAWRAVSIRRSPASSRMSLCRAAPVWRAAVWGRSPARSSSAAARGWRRTRTGSAPATTF